MRVVLRAGRVAERAGQETRDRVDEDQCGEFTSGQNVIADGDFVGDEMLADALVHALVAAADQGEAFVRGQRAGDGLRENASLRRKQNDGRSAQWSKNGFDRLEERLGLHHHPAAAAVGRVVGGVMFVARPVADVMQAHVNQPVLAGALKNTGFKVRGENFGQEGEDLELHTWILA